MVITEKEYNEHFKEFMDAQIKEIEDYKWCESEKAGRDLGNQCCLEWVEKYAKDFKEKFFSKYKK